VDTAHTTDVVAKQFQPLGRLASLGINVDEFSRRECCSSSPVIRAVDYRVARFVRVLDRIGHPLVNKRGRQLSFVCAVQSRKRALPSARSALNTINGR
jgi:hypothetical protein